jgi:prophage regulatory protein
MHAPAVLALGELIELLGLSKTRVRQLVATADFPAPIATLGVGKIWSTPDVVAFCERTGRTVHPVQSRPAS